MRVTPDIDAGTPAGRATATSRDVRAGCFVCHDGQAHWFGGNAQGVAARHHDATRHETWCDVALSIRYGTPPRDSRQSDIEDAIASTSLGDAPECAPLTEPDGRTVAPARLSTPEGRSSSLALAAATGAHRRKPPMGRPKPEHAHV